MHNNRHTHNKHIHKSLHNNNIHTLTHLTLMHRHIHTLTHLLIHIHLCIHICTLVHSHVFANLVCHVKKSSVVFCILREKSNKCIYNNNKQCMHNTKSATTTSICTCATTLHPATQLQASHHHTCSDRPTQQNN